MEKVEVHISLNSLIGKLEITIGHGPQYIPSKEQIEKSCSEIGTLVAKALQHEIETAVNNASVIHPETNSEKH